MISRAYITAWRTRAPWPSDAQIEQDLILSRALVEIFSEPFLQNALAFRGGTSLQKLFLKKPARYSEDIDLVQIQEGPIGDVLNEIRKKLDPWLGEPRWRRSKGNSTLIYKFESEIPPIEPLRLKVEINTREHFSVLGYKSRRMTVESAWFKGAVDIQTYELEEILGTKMRALYQRQKGRDLFDLDDVLKRDSRINMKNVVKCFQTYLKNDNLRISRAEFEENMTQKMASKVFRADIGPLLIPGTKWDIASAYAHVHDSLIVLLPGQPWKGLKKE